MRAGSGWRACSPSRRTRHSHRQHRRAVSQLWPVPRNQRPRYGGVLRHLRLGRPGHLHRKRWTHRQRGHQRGPLQCLRRARDQHGGHVAFAGLLDAGGGGIFTGPDPVGDKVIHAGDPLDGSILTALGFSREGLNDAGQLAFFAILADGRQGIYRADPVAQAVPAPSALLLAAVGLLALLRSFDKAWASRVTGDLDMRQALKPLLFDDDDPAAAEATRPSIVAPAQRSPRAKAKAATKRTEDGLPVHSFQTLLADLATLTQNQVRPRGAAGPTLAILATPTPLQQRAFELLGVSARL